MKLVTSSALTLRAAHAQTWRKSDGRVEDTVLNQMSLTTRIIEGYVHHGRIGVLVELATENPSSLQTEAFARLAKDITLQVAAANPESVDALLLQPFVKDTTLTIKQVIAAAVASIGDNVVVTRFRRMDTEVRPPA